MLTVHWFRVKQLYT